MTNSDSIKDLYGGKIRVRACGILIKDNKLVLVKHNEIGKNGFLWIPPGGGVEFGETATEGLRREFLEETGLEVEVQNLIFINELIDDPLHAIELFFLVNHLGGQLMTGKDPELGDGEQIISEVKFVSESEINAIHHENLHKVFGWLKNKEGLISFDSLLNLEVKYLN